MPTKSSWSSSSTAIGHRSRPHASPHRESARTPQPPQCSGDLGNPALDLTHFFLRVEKVGLAQLEPTVCDQKSTEKNNAKIFAICSRSRIDVHFCFGSDCPRRHSKTQSAIPGPTADCPRVRAILSTTLDDLARASFPAHMGRASSCAVHIGGDARPRPCSQA